MNNLQTCIVPWGNYKSEGNNQLQKNIRSYKKGRVNPDPDDMAYWVIEMKGLNVYELANDWETFKYKNMDL